MSKKEPKFPDGLPRFWALILAAPSLLMLAGALGRYISDGAPEEDKVVGAIGVVLLSIFALYWAYKIWTNRLGNKDNIRSFVGADQLFSLGEGRTYNKATLIVPPLLILAFIGFQVAKRSGNTDPTPDAGAVVGQLSERFVRGIPQEVINAEKLPELLTAYSEICQIGPNGDCEIRTNFNLLTANSGTAVSTSFIEFNGQTVTIIGKYSFKIQNEGICDTGLSELVINASDDVKALLENGMAEIYSSFPVQCENFSNVQVSGKGFSATSHVIMMSQDGAWYHDPETKPIEFR